VRARRPRSLLFAAASRPDVVAALEGAGCGELAILAGIETAAGVAGVEQVLRSPVSIAYFGAEDFVAAMVCVRTAGTQQVLYARSRVVLAARLAGVHALGQVVTGFDDEAVFVADAEPGRALGYGGKLCIRPRQVGWANAVFRPSPDELDRARRLLDAYDAAAASGDSVIVFEERMVDEPMARRARTLLDDA
jgi:citrate lyase subunit beta/citryl-CoA lyase